MESDSHEENENEDDPQKVDESDPLINETVKKEEKMFINVTNIPFPSFILTLQNKNGFDTDFETERRWRKS